MPQVHWVLPNGDRISDNVIEGSNLMDAAQLNGVTGIDGECGGCLSCATCHVLVEENWQAACPPMTDIENTMLDITTTPRRPNSRLSCQLIASAALDGIVLTVPSDHAN